MVNIYVNRNRSPFNTFIIQFIFLLFPLLGSAQTVLQGTVSDSTGKTLEGIHILISEPGKNIVIAFTVSDNLGRFQVKLKSLSDSLEIKTSSINFRNSIYYVENKNQNLTFILSPEAQKLKEITIRGAPVTQHGDTIDFSVKAFADQKDRVLADVLKKMPGIEIGQDGKIYYQGRAIQKYYIEGMDLLGGKYNTANDNLPYTSVSSVQILQNHQPKKILRGKIPTNKTSLNIKLKKNIAVTGTVYAGIGLPPFLWDVNITPMIFSKKQQLITSYKTNNTGNDVSRDLNTLTIEDLADALENNLDHSKNILNIKELSVPDFFKKFFVANNIHLLNTNYLFKTKNEYQIKVNISYLNDVQQSKGKFSSTYFLPNDTLRLNENVQNILYFNSLQGNVTIEKNISKLFLKNSFQIKSFWDSKKGMIKTDSAKIDQSIKNPYHFLKNKFQLILPVRKRFLTFTSLSFYSKEPQTLHINPGQFSNILNNGKPYYSIKQFSNINKFYTNNSIGMGFVNKNWKFNSKLGFRYINQGLNTSLQKDTGGNIVTLGTEFKNHLNLNSIKGYFQTDFYYEAKKLKVFLRLPVSVLLIKLSDPAHNKNQKIRKTLTEPGLFVEYYSNAYWKFTGNAGYHLRLGTNNQVYYGYIMNNYQLLQIRNVPIPITYNQQYAMKAEYSNPLNSLFANFGYNFSIATQNLIYKSVISDNGAIVLSAQEYSNSKITQRISGYFSYYFSPGKTTLSLETNISYIQGEQFINDNISRINSRVITVKPKINVRFWPWLNIEYNSNLSFFKTKINGTDIDKFSHLKNYINLNFYPDNENYIGFSCETNKINYSGQENFNYLAGVVYRYSLKKKKIDFEFRWNNVFNQIKYESAYINSFLLQRTIYDIRPSQVVFSIRFLF